jgi:hypothetical protein
MPGPVMPAATVSGVTCLCRCPFIGDDAVTVYDAAGAWLVHTVTVGR